MHKLKAFFAILLTVVTLTHSQPSKAAVGAMAAASGVATAGLILTATGAISIPILCNVKGGDWGVMVLLMIASVASVGIGVIVLDGEQQLLFNQVNPKDTAKLGLTSEEVQSFNEELDQANMLLSDVTLELTKMNKPSSQDSAKLWNEMKDLVSPATFSAMQKIASQK
jgi:hypothetical protein